MSSLFLTLPAPHFSFDVQCVLFLPFRLRVNTGLVSDKALTEEEEFDLRKYTIMGKISMSFIVGKKKSNKRK